MQPQQLAHLVEEHRSEFAPHNSLIIHVLYNPETKKVKVKNVFAHDSTTGVMVDMTNVFKEFFMDQVKDMVLKTNWNVLYNANKHLFL